MSVRELVKAMQTEIRDTPDLSPSRASELLMKLTALSGNCAAEATAADVAYSMVLLQFLETEEKANRATIKSKGSPEYLRHREAVDTQRLVLELIRTIKVFVRAQSEEMRLTR